MSKLDHLVLATPDLFETVHTVKEVLGVGPAEGGSHPGFGTRNFLLGLGDCSYLEIVGIDPGQPNPRRQRPFGLDDLTEPRLVTWAAQVVGIDSAVSIARAAGFDPGEISQMARATPEGRMLEWRLTLSTDGSHGGVIPFLIDWGTTPHPSAALPQASLCSFETVHPEPTAVIAKLKALSIDLTVHPGVRPALVATIEGPEGAITLL
ncbi:VOC family protein (plasmid) [Nocardia sp. NBC_01377]|uniref:VOC family protein n=1 Tax=Nocardia sp. NBC_01377 TaxID=2903595 RepID=UPI002F91A13D